MSASARQHVHVSRHPPGNGVNPKLHFDAAIEQQVRQIANGVLRLGDRHAVARHEHNPLGDVQHHRDLIRRGRFDVDVNFLR